MGRPAGKDEIKKTLGKIGALFGSSDKRKLAVLRCTSLEQMETAQRLLPRAFPRIQWQPVSLAQTPIARACDEAARAARLTVPVFWEFPGEREERVMSMDAAREMEAGVVRNDLLGRPLLLMVLAPSVRVLGQAAPSLWKQKGGYWAWPAPVTLPSSDEEATQSQAPAAPVPEGGEAPTQEETRKVLQSLHGDKAADYLVGVARSHLDGGDQEQARLFLLRAVQIYSQSVNLEGMAAAYHLLGLVAQRRGDYETALEWLEQAVDNLRIQDDRKRLAEVLGQKGYIYYLRGRIEPAVKAFREALDLDRELGLRDREAAGLRKIGMVLEMAQKFSAAADLYKESLQVEEELGSEAGQARVLHHLGRLCEQQRDFDQARDYYEQSLERKRSVEDGAGIATTLHQLGNLALVQGHHEAALERYEEALAAEREVGDRQSMARTLAQMGLACRELGQLEKALLHLVRAYQIFQRLRSPLAAEVLAKVEELQEQVPAETFNKILREASATTSVP